MRILVLAFALALAPLSAPAATASSAAAVAAAHQFMDALNTGDMKRALAVCANPVSIIDDFAPHIWHGAGACSDWAAQFAAFDKRQGISGDTVTLGTPLHADVTGDRAYCVFPATYRYVQHGKHLVEHALFTTAMQLTGGRWRITGWAWAKQ